jgi:hypothetical protein
MNSFYPKKFSHENLIEFGYNSKNFSQRDNEFGYHSNEFWPTLYGVEANFKFLAEEIKINC